jgi:hypothetical protein
MVTSSISQRNATSEGTRPGGSGRAIFATELCLETAAEAFGGLLVEEVRV